MDATRPAGSSAVIVLTTLPVSIDPAAFARPLVDERLAACVNVLPAMTSFYRWEGRIEEDAERQVILKTTRDRLAALDARIRALHPYEVPEILVLEVSGGSTGYLDWLAESVRANGA